jgi:cytochrome d ubiquinol oxidase subunit I
VTGAIFVLAVSSYFMLRNRDIPFARRSFAIASAFGLASAISVIVLGDESGYEVGEVQKVKLAAIEAEWETHPAPAAFTVVGLPNEETMTTDYALKIPGALGLIATRSLDEEVTGIKDLVAHAEDRIRNGIIAYGLLEKLRNGEDTPENRAAFSEVSTDLGYGLLLKRYTQEVVDATEEQIKLAARDTIPQVAPMFWTFRVMVGAGFTMLLLFVLAFYFSAKRKVVQTRWLQWFALLSLPLPWIASEMGWFVAEFGRQPWAIGEILPTYVATSHLTVTDLWMSLAGFIGLYTLFLVIEVYLMVKYIRKGPSALQTGRYHFEQNAATQGA